MVEMNDRDSDKAYRIVNERGTIRAYDSKGNADFRGIDAAKVINDALGDLEKDRIWKEIVEIRGNFTLNSPINIPSYVTVEINGILKLGGKDYDLINITNQKNIDIIGGELAGKGSDNGTTGWGIRTSGSGLQNNYIFISGVYAHDFRKSGIAINKSQSGVIVENCTCNNNGLNGIGFGDIYGFVARNNYCKSNLDTGLNIEDGWNFVLSDNTCIENIRHNLQLEHGVTGKIVRGIYSESNQFYGISIRNRAIEDRKHEKSKDIDLIDVYVSNNAQSGLIIQSSERVNVIGGTFKNNGQKDPKKHDGIMITDDGVNLSLYNSIAHVACYNDQTNKTQNYGIQEARGDYNIIIDNDVRNNISTIIKIVGSHTIVRNNISD